MNSDESISAGDTQAHKHGGKAVKEIGEKWHLLFCFRQLIALYYSLHHSIQPFFKEN